MLRKPGTNLSVGRRGTWPESPRWGSGRSPSIWTVGSRVEQSLGRGKGGRSSTGAPVVMGTIGTLCAQAGLDCRTTTYEGNGSKTTAAREPGTDDQWERGNGTTNPGDNIQLVEDHLNQYNNSRTTTLIILKRLDE